MFGAELSTAACVACDERKAAVDNSGRTKGIMLRGQPHRGQRRKVLFIRRELFQTGVGTMRVAPAEVVGHNHGLLCTVINPLGFHL